MATSPDLIDTPDPRRPVDRWLSSYSGDHVNPTNQFIHLLCVPAIVWSVTAAMWVIPVPTALVNQGAWMAVGMFLAWAWYWRLSRPLAGKNGRSHAAVRKRAPASSGKHGPTVHRARPAPPRLTSPPSRPTSDR